LRNKIYEIDDKIKLKNYDANLELLNVNNGIMFQYNYLNKSQLFSLNLKYLRGMKN